MRTVVETIDPERALDLLALNTNNRNIRDRHVDALAREMSSGRWVENGETIKVCGNVLADGQHRLLAVVKSGVPIKCIVVHGVSENAFSTIDVGAARTSADALKHNGLSYATTVSSATRMVKAYYDYIDGKHKAFSSAYAVKRSPSEILQFVEENPDIYDVFDHEFATVKKPILSLTIITGCFFLFSKANKDDAVSFFEKLIYGIDLKQGSPILLLRNKLIHINSGDTTVRATIKIGLVVTAWNAFRKGQTLNRLTYVENGARPTKLQRIL